MASKQTVATALMAAKSVFPHLWKDADIKKTAETWALLFQGVDDDAFTQAYFTVLQGATYPPVPGEITAELKRKPKQSINTSMEWERLVEICGRVNDLRPDFGYTYTPPGATRTQGEQARLDVNKLFFGMPSCLQDYIGSTSALLQYAKEMERLDDTGLQIRRRDYEKWRKDRVDALSLPELQAAVQPALRDADGLAGLPEWED